MLLELKRGMDRGLSCYVEWYWVLLSLLGCSVDGGLAVCSDVEDIAVTGVAS